MTSLGLKQSDLALKVLEKAAVYETELSKARDISPDDNELLEKLKSEYFVIRTLLVIAISCSSVQC